MKYAEAEERIPNIMKTIFWGIRIFAGIILMAGAGVSTASPCDPSDKKEASENQAGKPEYDGPTEYEIKTGEAVSITLTSSGEKPMVFEAEDIPPELTLDMKSGVIGGKISQEGTYEMKVTISNQQGKKTVTLTLKVKSS